MADRNRENTGMEKPILDVQDLKKYFRINDPSTGKKLLLRAVDGVSLTLKRGETVGLVGESGCGKSTFAQMVVRLIEPTSGNIFFKGQDLINIKREELRQLRRYIQIIFQDPYDSLNPRMTVKGIISEGWRVLKGIVPPEQWDKELDRLLERVGLNGEDKHHYPHQFSGGQRQRIGIARALALQPELIVCDEPVSALDVSVQAQVINLLHEIQDEFNLTYVFIAHDLSVVRHISDRVLVMYLGKVVESGPVDKVYEKPTHPYTQGLLSAVPIADVSMDREKRSTFTIKGDIPMPIGEQKGCPFFNRCWKAKDRCSEEVPELIDRGEGQKSACFFAEPIPIAQLG